MPLLSTRPRCPHCHELLKDTPKKKTPCPYCGKVIAIYRGNLLSEEDMEIEKWLGYVKPLGVTRRDFDQHRDELSKLAGSKASVNDTIWKVLNSLVRKYAYDHKKLSRAYLEMAELAASEWKDPNPYLDLADRWSPDGAVFLRRNEDPVDRMILKMAEAGELEAAGKIEAAIGIYEFLVKHAFPHPGPYVRLRILYSKAKRYADAIGICEAFIRVRKPAGYPEMEKQFAEWIAKFEQKKAKEIAKGKA